jgi:hypothetical protein
MDIASARTDLLGERFPDLAAGDCRKGLCNIRELRIRIRHPQHEH